MSTSYTHIDVDATDPIYGVVTERRPITVQIMAATVFDLFAIHDTIGDSDSWTLTHIPTGYRVQEFDSADIALRAAVLLKAIDIDWTCADQARFVDTDVKFRKRIHAAYKEARDYGRPE